MKDFKKTQRAKTNLLSDDFIHSTKKNKKRITNTILKAEKRSRESHGKYKSSSDSTS